MEVSKVNSAPVSSAPDFDIPESQKNAEWYAQTIRYYSRFYNSNSNILTSEDFRGNQLPVQRGLSMFLYYQGQQQNIDYNASTKDLSNNTLPAVWIPGKKVRSLIDYILGSIVNQMNAKVIGVTTLSKRATSERTKRLDALLLRYDDLLKDKIEQLQQAGVSFNPQGQKNFENKDQAAEWLNYDYRDSAEVYAEYIAKYIEESNDADSMYIKAALDYCAANYCGIHNYVENGIVYQKPIPFYNLIWDSRDPDKFNRNARFSGYREILTPQEVFIKFPDLSPEEREEIKTTASTDAIWNDTMTLYNTPNLNWWTNYPTGEKMVSVVTMYWKGMRDTKYRQNTTADGNVEYSRVKKNKTGEYCVEDIYMGTLIGNKYVTKWGLANNVVRNPENKSKPELPIKIFNGNTILGDGVSPIGLVAQNQDRIDFYRYKIIQSMGRDNGKVYLINGNKMSETVTGRQLMIDFKTMGLSVVNTASGESPNPSDANPLVQTIDMTLDPNVITYLNFIAAAESEMEQALSTSKIAMGQVQPQLGKSVQESATQLSTQGMAQFYKDWVTYNQQNLQYASNLAKIVYSMDGNFEAPMIVGDRGVRFLKIGKEYRWEDLLLYLRVKDVIGEADKARYIQVATAMAQQGMIDWVQFMMIDTAESKTQLRKDIEKDVQIKKSEQEQAAEVDFQRKSALQNQMIQGNGQQEMIRQQGEDGRTADRNQVALAKTIFDHEAKTQNQPA